MSETREKAAFQQRLIDSFDRSRVRQELAKVRGSRFNRLKKRYATMVLGASLAIGGIGIPMKTGQMLQASKPDRAASTAFNLAGEVTSGVEDAAATLGIGGLIDPIEEIDPLGEEELEVISEAAKKEFFESEIPFGDLIYKEALKHDIEPELVAAVVKTESQFKPNARSPVNAQGLMQLMPRTGRWMGARNLMDPTQNVKAGVKYLKYLEERFNGNETKILAAYNAGEGNVRRYGGVPPFKETRNYVKKVASAKKDFKSQLDGKVAEKIAEASPSGSPVVTR